MSVQQAWCQKKERARPSRRGRATKLLEIRRLLVEGKRKSDLKLAKPIGSLRFQAVDEVKKPLASAGHIASKGNTIALDGDGCESYIFNKASKKKIPIRQENNVYVLDVEYLAELHNSVGESLQNSKGPFQRPA